MSLWLGKMVIVSEVTRRLPFHFLTQTCTLSLGPVVHGDEHDL